MKIITLLSAVMLFSYNLIAQTITIRDKENNKPLEMVYIISKLPEAQSITNAKGQTDISKFKGSDKIEIRSLGYQKYICKYSDLEIDNFNVYLTQSLISMDEVVVSVSKWTQEQKDVVQKVKSISTKEIALQNPQTAADLLGVSGKVFIQKSQQGGGSPMIRGFSTNRLLYVVDGVRMNTAIFRSGNLQNVISLDPFAIERTEVMFGPSSAIYGSDAIGGVMNFQTLSPQYSFDNKILFKSHAFSRYSSANSEKTVHADFNIGFKRWAFVTSISHNNYGDLIMGSKGPDEYLRPFYVERQDTLDVQVNNENQKKQIPTAYKQYNIMQKVALKLNENIELDYGFHYSETSEYSRYDRHIRYKNGNARYAEWNYGPQKWMMNNFNLNYKNSHKLFDEINFKAAQQYFEESRINRDINDDTRYIRIEKVDAYSINTDFKKVINRKTRFFYGLEFVYNDVNSIGIDQNIKTNTSSDGASRYPNSNWSSYAAYISYHKDLYKKIHLQSSLRYNLFAIAAQFDTSFYAFPFSTANINNAATTGSIGIKYTKNENTAIHLNLSTGFRAPNIDDMGKVFDSAPGTVTVPNRDLKAEYAYNAELGFVKILFEQLKLDVAAYYTLLDNSMVRRAFNFNGLDSIMYDGELSKVEAIQNAANTKVYGIQFGFEWKPIKRITISSDINFQKGEEELDNGNISPSRHAAPTFGNSKINYTFKNFVIEVNSQYSASVKFNNLAEEEKTKTEIYAIDENGKPWSPSWYTLNIKSMYKIHDKLNLSVGIENITDQRYRYYSSGIAAAGRNYVISLDLKL